MLQKARRAPNPTYAQTYGVPTNLNQTTSRSGIGLTWDPNGNLLSYGSTNYVWTYGNRLAEVHAPGTDTIYAYDSLDRRTVMIEDGTMTRTLWSGADEVGEYTQGGALVRRFIPDGSGSMDARLAAMAPVSGQPDAIHWFHTDHQGSVIATSNAAGQAVGLTNYSPHGEFGTAADGVTLLNAPPTGSPFGYTGRQRDAKARLYQYRARYYSPELGIFLSMDPIGTKDDPNLYLYVASDPVNKTDPTGMIQERGEIQQRRRIEAAASDGVDSRTGLPVPTATVRGGTPEERAAVRGAVGNVEGTSIGRRNAGIAERRGYPSDIVIVDEGPNQRIRGTPRIEVNPDALPIVPTTEGPQAMSLEAVIGHEQGHDYMDIRDGGENRMSNVRQNENPVREELGQPPRTSYYTAPPPKL